MEVEVEVKREGEGECVCSHCSLLHTKIVTQIGRRSGLSLCPIQYRISVGCCGLHKLKLLPK